jgi:SAM-dependent methyltransferase
MNRHSKTPTIRFYNEHADEYVRATVGVNMESLYEPFLSHVPPCGRILDAGCGSGRDSKAFLDRGYQVVSIDASQEMVDATTILTAQQAHLLAFQEVGFSEEFDGVWACASLLHVPLAELPGVIGRLASALRPSGVLYASFKVGCGERNLDGRLFTDMEEASFTVLLGGIGGVELLQLWHTDDQRPDRDDKWLNVLLRKTTRY